MPNNRIEDHPEFKRAAAAGQAHLFAFYNSLTADEQAALVRDAQRIDYDLMKRLHREIGGQEIALPSADELDAPPVIALPTTDADRKRDDDARNVGEAALRAGRVAAFLVSGGQGSRLGFEGPKGAFPVGPVTERTLFEIFALKIRAIRKRYGCALPWLIMTSETNHDETVAFFESHRYFSLGKDSIRFFNQEMIPAMSADGKLLLSEKHQLFLSPNGHGGSIKALWDSGSIEFLSQQKIDTLFYFQVDNPLVKIGDPVYIGHHLNSKSDMSLKVVKKTSPFDKSGNPAIHKGKMIMIEYSDMPESLATLRDSDGELKFRSGSIAIHLFNVGFLERLNRGGFQLPYHRALKSIPYINERGEKITPEEKNGIKFETFVFDALPLADRTLVVETSAYDEFSPVKNKSGGSSPETSRKDMSRLAAHWLRNAGINVPVDSDGYPPAYIELSPETSLSGEGLERFKSTAIDYTRPVRL